LTSIERYSFHIEPLIFLLTFSGDSLNSKKLVSPAKAKICGLSNSMGHLLQICSVCCKYAVSQPADSGKRLDAIVSIAGISLPLQCNLNELVAVHQFSLSFNTGSLLPLQITEPVSSGKCWKIITYGFVWAFCYQFYAAGTPLNWI
jgi:hypothetical protein